MKKTLLFCIAGLLIHFMALGQYQLTQQEHILRTGDQHHFRLAQKAQPGTNGVNQIWDFSHLKAEKDLISHMLPYNTPQKVANVNASVVLEEFGTHFLFELSGNRMLQTGTKLKGGAQIIYEKPLLRMRFPITYGTLDEGDYQGYFNSGDNKRNFFGHYRVEADATGTLILPGTIRIENTIRVKTTKIQSYEKSNSASEVISYKWYAKGCRYPLLTIIQAGCGDAPTTIRTAYYADASKLINKELKPQVREAFFGTELSGFPNPASEKVTIAYSVNKSGPVTIELFTTQGRKLAHLKEGTKKPGKHEKPLNIRELNLPSGLIIVKLITADRQQDYRLQVIH